MDSALYRSTPDGFRELTVSRYEYQPLNHDSQEQRFLILYPCPGDKTQKSNHVKCSLEIQVLSNVGPNGMPFIAVKNSRGYRLLQDAIEVDGKALLIPAALEQFLRHFRRSEEPICLWIRHICLVEFDKEEKERYWTRMFIDSMYERASDVVDMSSFNNNLLESGAIETIQDSRYSERAKTWYGNVPSQTSMPTVYPIQIGQRVSEDDPTEQLAYVPLDMIAKEIRVLLVNSSTDPAAPITVHLAHCPVNGEVLYQALSYTWGTTEPTVDIVVNGQIMTIRKSLEEILRAVRRPEGKVIFWIDAVSINQTDLSEKNRQLPLISKIYDYAACVVSYIGAIDDSANEALDFVQHLQEPMMLKNEEGNWDIGKDAKIPPKDYFRLCAALYKLLARPYFRRIWILQEVAYASHPVVGCGTRFDFTFDQLEQAAYNLQDMLRRDRTLANEMKRAAPDLKTVSGAELVYVRKLFYFRYLISKGSSRSLFFSGRANIRETSPGLLETVILARDFQATVGHDKIFGLWNLAQDKDGLDFKMDYTETVPDSFTKFAIAWATQHKSLDIIAAAVRNEKSKEFYDIAPSWCPDWTTPSVVGCLVRRESIPLELMMVMEDLNGKVYSADGGMENDDLEQPLFEFDDKTLLCSGVIVDRIEGFVSTPDPDPDEEAESHYIKFFGYMHAITDAFAERKDCPYKDPEQAAWAMLHGDVSSVWLPRGESQHSSDDYPWEQYVCEYNKSRYIRRWGNSYSRTDTWDAVQMMLKGRTPAISRKGYLCLLPHYITDRIQEPWVLAILATCSVPIVLQEFEEGFYRVAGSCFVQGWMEGEVFAESMGAESPRAFWAARQGKERLRIL